ncbi:MAG: thioredoxin family protein [Myxococcota bacterium]
MARTNPALAASQAALALAIFLGSAASALAQSESAQSRVETALDEGEPRIAVSLVADRAGDTLRVGVHFDPDPGWHVYWKNPGQSGVATEVLLEGLSFGAIQWPAPERFEAPGPIVTYGYHDTVLYADAPAPAETAHIKADVDFLVCEVDCIPARVLLEADVDPRAESSAIRAAATRIPALTDNLVLEGRWPARGETTQATLRCREGACAFDPDHFFPERVVGLDIRPAAASGSLTLHLGASSDVREQALRGVVQVGEHWREFDLSMEPAARGTTSPRLPSLSSFGLALLFAFLGGLILNLMPCVLPVLTIKILGVLRLAETPARARHHGWAYAFGVVASMIALAGIVLAFRAGGQELGWGFHLQEPRFVGFLAALLTVLALGLFGVFHLQVGGSALAARVDASDGLSRSVGEGVLAVILATPCSAPLLGTAVGYALAQPAHVVIVIFAAVGAGLAAPFVLLVYVPPLMRRVPKPGPWMTVLERLLGFSLLGAAVWLVWIYGQTTGVNGMAILLALLLALTFGVWTVARGGRRGWVVAAPIVAAAGWMLWTVAPQTGDPHDEWRAWEESAVQAELDAGRSALVVFTADWCVTCKVNERFVLHSDEVERELSDTAVFVADWTLRDDRIRAELARYGRAGVPLTLVYHPSAPERPLVLPELLSKDDVLTALRPAS